jgi:hypothetical protein
MLDTIVCSDALFWPFSPAWDAVALNLDVGFICPFVVIDPTDTDQRATPVVAPGRRIYSFPTFPDAESVALYSMVIMMALKLACVCYKSSKADTWPIAGEQISSNNNTSNM